MRKLFLNLYVIIFLLVSDYALYAQGPTEDTPEGGDPVAPINTRLILLAIAAVGFAYYYFSKRRQEKQLTSK